VSAKPAKKREPRNGQRARRALTERKLLDAVGQLIAREGVEELGINAVAKAAGVDKVLIYRYFDGLGGLLRRFGESADFWPSLDEVLGPQRDVLREASAAGVAGRILINYTRALRRRPTTLQLLAWECCHRNELTRVLEETRERWSQALLQEIRAAGVPMAEETVRLSVLLSAAVHYLAIRGREIRMFSGMDVGTERGWRAIETTITAAFAPPTAPQRRKPRR
jgi:AcrR family transcriptional regulator